MIKKIIVYSSDANRHVLVYNQQDELQYFVHNDVSSLLPESIVVAKISAVNIKNSLAFIEYAPGKTGVINLLSTQKLQVGSMVLCQAIWLGDQNKYPKFSNEIKQVGKYVILMDKSAKIKTTNLSQVLLNMMGEYPDYSIIFRTKARELNDLSVVEEELLKLAQCQQNITRRGQTTSQVTQLTHGVDTCLQIMRSCDLSEDFELVTNDYTVFTNAQEYLDLWQINSITLDKELCVDIAALSLLHMQQNVLMNNGSLVIHKLSGINLIDVNSEMAKLTFFQVNYLAIDEIVRQIKLRDLTGIILIDFIKNMQKPEEIKIITQLSKLLSEDWRHSRVLGFTRAGICEIIRNKSSV